MPITIITTNIYKFIREYSSIHRVNLSNIQAFARKNNISQRDMGYALQLLKQDRRIKFTQRYGWIAY